MHHQRFLSLLKAILSQPTAPYHEYHVRAEIIQRLSKIPDVSWKTDAFGNVIARFQRGRSALKWAIGVHMDHPGWINVGSKTGQPKFLGGVPARYLEKPANRKRIRDFGDFSMWDLPAFTLEKGRIYGRACDDLIGCALTIAFLEELAASDWQGSCGAIFSRAEEVGFVGALSIAEKWPLGKSTTFLSLETSAPAGEVKIGNGPVCRVGDRISIFDSEATSEIVAAAAAEKIPTQRALLDRGACEATAIQTFGIRSAGISVPLGNYHNCGPKNQIAAEFVDLSDVKNSLRLLIATVTGKGKATGKHSLKSKLKNRRKTTRSHAKAAEKSWSTFAEASRERDSA